MKKLKRNPSERAAEFLKNLSNEERILVLHHNDVDGIVSASLILKALENIGIIPKKVMETAIEDTLQTIKENKKIDKYILLDLAIHFAWKELKKMGEKMLIIDHHPPDKDMNEKNIVYVNPTLKNRKIYQPVSYLIYKMFSRDFGFENFSWLALIGTVGDYGYEDCEDLMKGKIYVKRKEDVWKTRYGVVAKKLNASLGILGFKKTLKILTESSSMEELEKNKIINKVYAEYNKEYEKIKKIFWQNAERYPKLKLVISDVGNVSRIYTSALATELSVKNRKIIILLRRAGKICSVNARTKLPVGLGELMKKCMRGLNGGGGHYYAAGGWVKVKNVEIFRKRLIKEIELIFKAKKAK